MNRFQMAKLVDWAETLETRKRMQKVVFMLQAAGCPLQVDFYLHRYGPYSIEVAGLTDQLVRDGILNETETTDSNRNSKYKYQLTDQGKIAIQNAELGTSASDSMLGFEELAKSLMKEPLWTIEVASTIVFFRNAPCDWETAKSKAFQFKSVDQNTEVASQSEALARRVFSSPPM